MSFSALGFNSGNHKKDKPTSTDNYNYIAVNQVYMWISNNGDGSHDPRTDGNGFYWPGGINATQTSIYEDGLVWGGTVGPEIRAGGSTYRHGLQAGPILENGSAANPADEKYRVYKIKKGWEDLSPGPEKDQYGKDYNEWPADEGAPYVDVDQDGIFTRGVDKPKFVGDETLWCVSNDLDTSKTINLFYSLPMGIEQQLTVYAFNNDENMKDVVFKKYKLINKGKYNIKDMYFGYFTDDDLGFAGDDYTGCDTTLYLGYTYNSSNTDDVYGSPVPAVGHKFVQTPIIPANVDDEAIFNNTVIKGYKNLPMSGFNLYIGGNSSTYKDVEIGKSGSNKEIYNNLRGRTGSGSTYFDPVQGFPTCYSVPGDPVGETGWYEGSGWPSGPSAGDRRYLMDSGPFNMAPGDTQEVVIAIFMAKGTDNIQSVAELQAKASYVQYFYYQNFLVSVDDKISAPDNFELSQNYPNPFNPATKIKYNIAKPAYVTLKVFDILGKEVASLVNEEKQSGNYSIDFNSKNFPSGVYIYQLKAGSFTATKKMILLK